MNNINKKFKLCLFLNIHLTNWHLAPKGQFLLKYSQKSIFFTQKIRKNKYPSKQANHFQIKILMGQNYLNLTQNLILKLQYHNFSLLFKKKSFFFTHMEVQQYQTSSIDLQSRKQSQNTCHSSNGNSPNLDQKEEDHSAVKSFKAFSTGLSSPMSHETPQKVFQIASMDNLTSLQNHSLSLNVYQKMGTNLQSIKSQSHQDKKEKEQLSTVTKSRMQSQESTQQSQQQQIGNNNNIQPKYKQQQLAPYSQNQNRKIFTQKTQQQNILTKKQTQNQSQSVSNVSQSQNRSVKLEQKTVRPLPTYKQARPALYSLIRNLCSQMNMSFDVFGLAMKYLDEYHTTYGHKYERNTFSLTAYAMIILASKMMNKRVLTPKIISQKTNLKRDDLEKMQMKLINLMCYKVYFQTFVKLLQRKCQIWENHCILKNLTEFSIFEQSLSSFKRFYLIVRQVQIAVRQNKEINNEILLDCFIKVLVSEFTHSESLENIFDLLKSTFACSQENILDSSMIESIDKKMKSTPVIDLNEFELCEKINKTFERRNNKQFNPTYGAFMNSIFDIKF